MAQDILSRLKVIIGADNRQFLTGIQKSQQQLVGFTKSITSFARLAGGAFAVREVVQFASRMSELEDRARGVQIAFDALNNPNLLNNLRRATAGTVSDLELMRQSVRAANFQIPVEKLAGAFEFARKRAAATGEEVDYLVQSIIDGVGRKSTLILDDLGISASEIQAEFKKTGDFATAAFNLISREAAKMPEALDSAIKSSEKLNVAWENLSLTLSRSGQGFSRGFFSTFQLTLAELIDQVNSLLKGIDAFQAKQDPSKPFSIGGGFDVRLPQLNTNVPAQVTKPIDLDASVGIISNLKTIELRGEGVRRKFSEIIDEINRLKATSLQGGQFGDSFQLFGLDSSNQLGKQAQSNLASDLQERFKAAGAQTQEINRSIQETINLTGTLTSAFAGLFNSIIQGGRSAEDILKGFASTLLGGALNAFTGGLFSGLFGGGGGLFSSAGPVPLARVTGDQLTFVQTRNSQRNKRIGT